MKLFSQNRDLSDSKFSFGAGYVAAGHRAPHISPTAGLAPKSAMSFAFNCYPEMHQHKVGLIGILSRERNRFQYDTFGEVKQKLIYTALYINYGVNLNPYNKKNRAVFLEFLMGKENGSYRFVDKNHQRTKFLQAPNPEKNYLFGMGLFCEFPIYLSSHYLSVASNVFISEFFSTKYKKTTQPSPFKLNLQYEFVF